MNPMELEDKASAKVLEVSKLELVSNSALKAATAGSTPWAGSGNRYIEVLLSL